MTKSKKDKSKDKKSPKACIHSHLSMIEIVDKDVERTILRLGRKAQSQKLKALETLQLLDPETLERMQLASDRLEKKLKQIRKHQQNLASTSYKQSGKFIQRYFRYLKSLIQLETLMEK